MVHGYHVSIPAYGFWLPNDPRGSWSKMVRKRELLRLGLAPYRLSIRIWLLLDVWFEIEKITVQSKGAAGGCRRLRSPRLWVGNRYGASVTRVLAKTTREPAACGGSALNEGKSFNAQPQ